MMTEAMRRARLFLGSYVLLFVLLAIRFQTAWLEIACGVIAAVGFVDMLCGPPWAWSRATKVARSA
jgi:hypothetical protein